MSVRAGTVGATIGTVLTLLISGAFAYLEKSTEPDHLGVCLGAITRCDCTGGE